MIHISKQFKYTAFNKMDNSIYPIVNYSEIRCVIHVKHA